jgi:hypothetical protein
MPHSCLSTVRQAAKGDETAGDTPVANGRWPSNPCQDPASQPSPAHARIFYRSSHRGKAGGIFTVNAAPTSTGVISNSGRSVRQKPEICRPPGHPIGPHALQKKAPSIVASAEFASLFPYCYSELVLSATAHPSAIGMMTETLLDPPVRKVPISAEARGLARDFCRRVAIEAKLVNQQAVGASLKRRIARHPDRRPRDAILQDLERGFAKMHVNPKPVQQPHPPIWTGGTSDAALRRTAAVAAVWQPTPLPAAELVERMNFLKQSSEKIEREQPPETRMSFRVEFSDITGNSPPMGNDRPAGHGTPAEVAGDLSRYREAAGVSAFQINFHGNRDLGQLLESMKCFMRDVQPRLQ